MKTFVFHIWIPPVHTVWRKLELRADQTLQDLHLAIQDAFEFDDDHLYSFFMSGKPWDQSTEYSLPEGTAEARMEAELLEFYQAFMEDERDTETKTNEITEVMGMPPAIVQSLLEQARQLSLQKPQEGELIDSIAENVFGINVSGDPFFDPDEDEPGDATTTRLDDLQLVKGKKFLYLFDYGDQWEFSIRVHQINLNAPEGDYPRLVKSKGDPPPQYPDVDDEDFYIEFDIDGEWGEDDEDKE